MKTIYLSYYINEQSPLYGGEKAVFIDKRSEIAKGASSNTKYLRFPNHTGTHIDFPRHFSDKGKTINDFPADFWRFHYIFVINYKAQEKEIIGKNILEGARLPKETEFLIIKTGFGKYRDKEIYWKNNPGLSPELAFELKKRCPELKIVGFDFISVSSYQNRMLGREAHKVFLLDNDILLMEDMKLDELKNSTVNVITALPLMIDRVDGVPITIIADMD